ncbi:MAG TPA: VWA domain-containing protein [Blastocatellia bacterium]|nr:VWA domain-containing protein [Blastocatellia bacterium]
MQHTLRRCAPAFVLSLCVCLAALPAASVKADDKKPKREKFGSSLKRLKWDKATQAAVEKPDKSGGKKPKESKESKEGGDSDAAVKLKTLLVTFDVLVTDASHTHIIEGLGKNDFIVTEDDQPQYVETFARGDDVNLPRSIILLIDWSPSQRPFIEKSVAAAKTLVGQLGPADEMAIITDDVELVCDYTRDKARLGAALDKIAQRASEQGAAGQSLQFTALFAALRELVGEEQRRPIIIFQTDGDQAVSFRDQPEADKYDFLRRGKSPENYGLADIFAAARKSRATIYSVMTNERLTGLPESQVYRRGAAILQKWWQTSFDPDDPRQLYRIKLWTDLFLEGQKAAARVAMTTGGWMAFLEKPEQAEGIYATILKDINQRYVIGYYPTNAARDGKPRSVKITVRDHPEYYVHGRNTYYAPEAP